MDLSTSTFMLPQNTALTPQQTALQQRLFAFIKQHKQDRQAAVFVLHGDAGSGKSVVLNAVFTALQKAGKTPGSPFFRLNNKLLVNHNEMLKIYWEVARQFPYLAKKDYQKPTPFINAQQKAHRRADVVFVDEAQLLLSQKDAFNHYNGSNQLDDLLQLTHVLVLVEDFQQVVKLKSRWTPPMLADHLTGYEVAEAELTQQQRMQDPQMAAWINAFIQGDVQPLPQLQDYEVKIFADGAPLARWVAERDKQYGLARMIATTDFPFRVYGSKTWYVQAGSVRLPWDKVNFTDRPWASRPETLGEVGSIYTIQGFDLNYAGVILGPSLSYDEKARQLVADPSLFEDQTAFRKRPGLADPEKTKRQIILNVANILLKRGRQGLGIFAVDPVLERKLLRCAN